MVGLLKHSLESAIWFSLQNDEGLVVLIKRSDLIEPAIIFNSRDSPVNWMNAHRRGEFAICVELLDLFVQRAAGAPTGHRRL